jgi:uncharacterized repeat protein (TIGR02543 family)
VTYDANGGNTPVPTSNSVTFGSTYGTLATTSRTGYAFNGWFTAISGGTQVTTSTLVSTASNHTIYAHWTASTYTVSYDANGGNTPVPTSNSVTFGSPYGTLATTSRTSYTFNGWFTAASGGTQVTASTVVTTAGNHTLYAQWTALNTHNIPLLVGWNLVSFKLHPASTLTADVLSSIAGNYDLVYAWDATAGKWMKYAYGVGYGNTLDNLDETIGFWVRMTTADTLEASGTAPVSSSISLKTGWNLVGFPTSAASLVMPDAFSLHGLASDPFLVYAYHAGESDLWKVYESTAPSYSNDLLSMAPGYGYWVKVNSLHTWTVTY